MNTSNIVSNIVSKTNGFNRAILCVIRHEGVVYAYRSTTHTWHDDAFVSVEFQVGESSGIWCYNTEDQSIAEQLGCTNFVQLYSEEFGQIAARLGLYFRRTVA